MCAALCACMDTVGVETASVVRLGGTRSVFVTRPEVTERSRTAGGLGMLLHDKGDLAAAEPLLRESADGLAALQGNRPQLAADAITTRAAYCELLLAKGDLDAADEQRRILQQEEAAHYVC